MGSASRKGDRRERELVNLLHEQGFAVMRAPASGSATERELPDVLAGDDGYFLAIEAKSSGGDPIYIDAGEVDDLRHFANRFEAIPVIAARFDRMAWYFFSPEELYQTDSGNYRIKAETAEGKGATVDDLICQDTFEGGR